MNHTNNDSAKALQLIYENILQEAMLPPAIVQHQPAITHHLIEYIKNVENNAKVGYKNGLWYPYRVSHTEVDIGYGHKMAPGEDYNAGLTDQQVEKLLMQDLEKAQAKAKLFVNQQFSKNTWDNLDTARKEMLTEFTFNLGSLRAFPKFVKSVVYNDVGGMKKEYHRGAEINGSHHDLTRRNQAFFDTFLKNYKGGYFIAS